MLWLVILAWVLGVGSLASFGAFLWTGSFGLLDLRLDNSSALAFDATLCLLFFLQHSVLIRRSVRNALRRVLPEYCHGVGYTLSSAVVLLALVLLWQQSPVELYRFDSWGRWIARSVLVLAFLGFFWGIRTLEGFDAFGTSAVLARIQKGPAPPARLTIKGPYRLVRHPFYSCAMLALWATPVLSLDRVLLNVLFTAWIFVGAHLEERDLLAQFGDEYERYRRAVPMFLPRRRTTPAQEAREPAVKGAGHGGGAAMR